MSGGFLIPNELRALMLEDNTLSDKVFESMELANKVYDAIEIKNDKIKFLSCTYCSINLLYNNEWYEIELPDNVIDLINSGKKIVVKSINKVIIE